MIEYVYHCDTCKWMRTQRNNKHMGFCTYPLPMALRKFMGEAAIKKGIYHWKHEFTLCPTYQASDSDEQA